MSCCVEQGDTKNTRIATDDAKHTGIATDDARILASLQMMQKYWHRSRRCKKISTATDGAHT
jgi:hypothetical protein